MNFSDLEAVCDRLITFFSEVQSESEFRRSVYLSCAARSLGFPRAEIRRLYRIWEAEKGGES